MSQSLCCIWLVEICVLKYLHFCEEFQNRLQLWGKICVYELSEKHRWSSWSVFFSWYCLGDSDLKIQNSRDATPCRSANSCRIQTVLHWIWQNYGFSKHRWVFTSRQGVASQKTCIFSNIAVRNWRPWVWLAGNNAKLQELHMLMFNIKFGIHVRFHLISPFICNSSWSG
jgi:hypothetical protein